MKLNIYIILAIAFTLSIESCVSYHIRKGNESFDHLAYSKAVEHYTKATKKASNLTVQSRMAESYFKMNDLVNAEKTYSSIINSSGIDTIHYLNYGRVLIGSGKCDKAEPWLKKYLEFNTNDFLAKTLLASCKSISDRMIDTTLYTLKPIILDEFANSFSAIEYQNGIVFTADKTVFQGKNQSPWTGNSYLGLFEMKKTEKGNWLEPTLLQGDVNGPFHDGPATFANDGQTVYFTRNNYYKKQLKADKNNVSNLKIFKATLVNGEWKNLEEFPFNSDDFSNGHPTVSEDGKTLYFVSDMPGGYGGTDIYVSHFDGTSWSKPVNLGATINTPGNEMFPYIHTDGSLYFSSDAHNSMGGLDVFITSSVNNKWLQPENLNYPLNSSKDDFAFTLSKDNTTGFVSSMRSDADKVYSFTKNDPTFILIGKARKKGTDIPVEGANIQVSNLTNGEVTNILSDKNGKFTLPLSPNSDYLLTCTKKGCFTRTENISTKNIKYSQNFYADFEVEEIIINKPIVLENIFYDFDKWEIRDDAALELEKLVKILIDNPDIHIEMGSHTDARGSDNYNEVLSNNRAQSAVNYLISRGISADRLTWKGYGEKVPVNKCVNGVICIEEEHQINRRTEFKVTRIVK